MNRQAIEALIPHKGAMCLLEEVTSWDEARIACRAVSHRAGSHPMRYADILPGLAGIEYAAQAMAIHGGLTALHTTPRKGFLASLREVACHVARLDDIAADLTIEAARLAGEDARVIYAFTIHVKDRILLSGRAAVVLEA